MYQVRGSCAVDCDSIPVVHVMRYNIESSKPYRDPNYSYAAGNIRVPCAHCYSKVNVRWI